MKIQNNLNINSIVSRDNYDKIDENKSVVTEKPQKYDVIDIKPRPAVAKENAVETNDKVNELKDSIVNKLNESTSKDRLAELKQQIKTGGYTREGGELVLKIIL